MTSSTLLPYSACAHLSHFALAHGRAGTLAHRHVEGGLVLARGQPHLPDWVDPLFLFSAFMRTACVLCDALVRLRVWDSACLQHTRMCVLLPMQFEKCGTRPLLTSLLSEARRSLFASL